MTEVEERALSVARAEHHVETDVIQRGRADVAFLRLLDHYKQAVREHAFAQARAAIDDIVITG